MKKMTNEITCKYIDKDKILPYLIKLHEDGVHIIDIEFLIKRINEGFFDWQQGSE